MYLRQPLPTPTDRLIGWLVSATGVKAAELTDALGGACHAVDPMSCVV